MCPPGDPPKPPRDGGVAPAVGRGVARRPSIWLAGFAVLGLALAFGLAGIGGATSPAGTFQTNDTDDPTVGNLSKVNVTAMELVIVDDVDVDESSVDADDFVLSAGRLDNATATEDGSNATVMLVLNSTVDRDTVTVSIAENTTVTDEAGNELDTVRAPSRSVDGMDGARPDVRSLKVKNGTNGTIDIQVSATEELSKLFVTVNGPEETVLDMGDFEKTEFATYVASVDPGPAGEYRVRVSRLVDLYDNTRPTSVSREVHVDVEPPDAVAGIDFGASEGLVITFDGGRTTDANPVRNFTWDFGDGSTETGERVSHRFDPGNYTVTLEATDVHGNTGTDHLQLDLSNHNASIDAAELLGFYDVSISANPDAESGAAVIDVPEASVNQSVLLAAQGDEPIATARAVSLRSMAVTLSRNASYSIAVQIDGPSVVGDAAAATNGSVLAGMTLVHDVPEQAIKNVTLTVGVDRERLNATDEVGVYRFHNDSWGRLASETLNGTNETARYRVESPGLSRFAVVREPAPGAVGTRTATATATATPVPPVAVVDASLNASSVDPATTVGASATVLNRGDETAAFTAGLAVDGSVVETRELTIPPGERRSVSFAREFREPGSYVLAVNGTGAGTVTVGDEPSPGLLSFLGVLPLGLLQTVVTYVGGLLVAVFLVLKAAALYLGY